MAYSNFTIDNIEQKLGLELLSLPLNLDTKDISPSERLKFDLQFADNQSILTEKAKSEWIVIPILKELLVVNDFYFKVYSGSTLNANPEKGLNGECDFILTKNVDKYGISHPILQIVEAKRGELEIGVPQCAAQLLGAKIFNENRGTKLEKIYGCITNGKLWKFLRLEGEKVSVDTEEYTLKNLPELLGAFQSIIDLSLIHI